MNLKYRKLELDKILEMLKNEAWSDMAKEKLDKLEPSYDIEIVRKELKKCDDAFVFSSKFGTPRFYNIKDVSASAKRAAQGAMLSLRELLDIGLVLRETEGLIQWYDQCGGTDNSLNEYFALLAGNKTLENTISNSIVSENELSDGASAELARIRKAIIRQGMRIKEQLDSLIKSKTTQKYLQVEPDQYFVENVKEFPLIIRRGERDVARCPSGYDRRGKLYFSAEVKTSDSVRLSYANPRQLISNSRFYAEEMYAFAPQALLLIVCANRDKFLKELSCRDKMAFREVSDQLFWVHGFAEMLLDQKGRL